MVATALPLLIFTLNITVYSTKDSLSLLVLIIMDRLNLGIDGEKNR